MSFVMSGWVEMKWRNRRVSLFLCGSAFLNSRIEKCFVVEITVGSVIVKRGGYLNVKSCYCLRTYQKKCISIWT